MILYTRGSFRLYTQNIRHQVVCTPHADYKITAKRSLVFRTAKKLNRLRLPNRI